MKLIELLAEDTIDKARLKSFDKGYNEGISVLKEFAEKVKEKLFSIFGKTICSDLDTEDITNIIDELLDEILEETQDDGTRTD